MKPLTMIKPTLVFIAGMFTLTFGVLVFGQEADEAVTIHARGWFDIVTTIAALFGAGGALAAVVPAKVRVAIAPLNMFLTFIGLNYFGSKNKVQKAGDEE